MVAGYGSILEDAPALRCRASTGKKEERRGHQGGGKKDWLDARGCQAFVHSTAGPSVSAGGGGGSTLSTCVREGNLCNLCSFSCTSSSARIYSLVRCLLQHSITCDRACNGHVTQSSCRPTYLLRNLVLHAESLPSPSSPATPTSI